MAHQNQPPESAADLERRRFLQAAGAVGAALGLAPAAPAAPESAPPESPLTQRNFGKTDVKISLLGFGGHHLGDNKDVEVGIRLVHEAVDSGITFFDNCWEYYNGRTEEWYGRALDPARRKKIFLMTKVCTHGRGADLAMQMLEESLRRMRTDHLDLWQIHGVGFDNDPDLAYARGGVLEALEKAKKQGKTRFVGFTGHKDPGVHLRMVQLGFPFDSVQMPLNPFDATFRSFEQIVLPELVKRGIAPLGMKSQGGTADAVRKGVLKAEEALRYAMSLPVATVISGMPSVEVLRKNVALARDFKPYTAEEMQALRDRCAKFAADGRFELFKVSLRYDNPQARLPHGFPIDPTQKEVKEEFQDVMGGPP